MAASILKALGLADVESGTYLGNGEWAKTADAGVIEVINPSTHEVTRPRERQLGSRLRNHRQTRPGRLQDLAHDAGAQSAAKRSACAEKR